MWRNLSDRTKDLERVKWPALVGQIVFSRGFIHGVSRQASSLKYPKVSICSLLFSLGSSLDHGAAQFATTRLSPTLRTR